MPVVSCRPRRTCRTRGMRQHNNRPRVRAAHHACYQLRICHRPPRMAPTPRGDRRASAHSGCPAGRDPPGRAADSLIVFREYLAATHHQVRALPQLTGALVEGFLTYNHRPPCRHRTHRPLRPARPDEILRGTGLRLGNCSTLSRSVRSLRQHGSWLKVPLGGGAAGLSLLPLPSQSRCLSYQCASNQNPELCCD